MTAVLETRDLKKHYRMGDATVRALDGVSLTVQEGEFVGLLGTSGSGKSTLLNLIAGLDRPSEGSLRIFDQDLAHMSSNELSHHRQENVGHDFRVVQPGVDDECGGERGAGDDVRGSAASRSRGEGGSPARHYGTRRSPAAQAA